MKQYMLDVFLGLAIVIVAAGSEGTWFLTLLGAAMGFVLGHRLTGRS
jgi:hypothetical protein